MHLHFHLPPGQYDLVEVIERICRSEALTKFLQDKLMPTLDQLIDDVRGKRTVVASMNTMLDGVRAQVAAILSGDQVAPATQAKVDALFAELQGLGSEIAEVVTENTPAATPPANG